MSLQSFFYRRLRASLAVSKLLAASLLVSAAAHAATASLPTIVKPRGVFADAGATNSTVVKAPQNRGVLVRVAWQDLEPNPGYFNMAAITDQLRVVNPGNISWTLAVLGGPSSPSWLYSSPYNVGYMTINSPKGLVRVPKFWDAGLQKQLSVLASALGKQFGSNANLKLVYLPQMSANGIEGHFNGNSNSTLTSQGFTQDLWVSAVMQAAQAFATAFPQKPIAIELHYLLGTASAGQSIMKQIAASPVLLNQVGVAMWWLSGNSTYQPDLLSGFAQFPGNVYAQLIDKSTNTASFANHDYTTAFTQAKQLGIHYVEPWDVDVQSQLWVNLFQSFNTFAGT